MFHLGWSRAMEIVHLEQWVQFMDDKELDMWYKDKLLIAKDSDRLAHLSPYEERFLENDIQTLAKEIHRRKFKNVLHKLKKNVKLLEIMDKMEVYYMFHLHEKCPGALRTNIEHRIVDLIEGKQEEENSEKGDEGKKDAVIAKLKRPEKGEERKKQAVAEVKQTKLAKSSTKSLLKRKKK